MVDLSIELPDQGDHIIRTHDLVEEYNPKGLGDEIYLHMKRHKDSVAQIEAETGKTDTYGSFLQRCVRTAIEMKARGVTSGDVVTPCTLNHLNSHVPFVAGLFIGAKVASLDPSLSLNDTKYLLNQVKPKMVFVEPENEQFLAKAIREAQLSSEIVVFGDTTSHIPFAEFLKPSPEEANFMPFEAANVKDTALIFFSSGTTGLPKGVCTNHYSNMVQLNSYMKMVRFSGILMNFTSLYWVSGAGTLLQSILSGSSRVVCSKFNPISAFKYIDKYRVTSMLLSSTDGMAMLKDGCPNGLDLSSLKSVLIGGSPLSTNKLTQLRKMFPGAVVILGYGQTEVGGATGFNPTPEGMKMLMAKPGSVGQPRKGFWYKIVDPETEKVLGPNEKGELRLKTKFQMNGYHNLDSSYVWDSEGYLKTGDICYYDDDHCFYVVDRLKEMLKYRSWHVAPALLEGILLEHPAVNMAVVIGLPHEEDGDHPMALVELAKDAGNVTEDELVKFVDERVDDRKRLRGGVRFITDVPYTPSSKVNRYLLKKQILGS